MENRENKVRTGSEKSVESKECTGGVENMESTECTGGVENMESTEHTGSIESMERMEPAENAEKRKETESAGNTGRTENKGNRKHKQDRESSRSTKRYEHAEYGGNMRKRGDTVRKKKLTGSFAAKVVAFFLLVICVFGAVVSGILTIGFASEYYYSSNLTEIFLDRSYEAMLQDIYKVRDYIASGDLGYAKGVCEDNNIDIALLKGDLWTDNGSATDNPVLIWTTYKDSYEIGVTKDFYMQFPANSLTGNRVVNYQKIYAQKDYVFRVYFNMDFPEEDLYAELYKECIILYNIRYTVLWILGISILLGLNSFLFLMCSAGHRNDAEGIQPSVFSSIPLDLYTAGYGIVAIFLFIVMTEMLNGFSDVIELLAFSAVTSVEALWCTFYLRELAVRMKKGYWWRNTIIYRVLRLLKRMLLFLGKGIFSMVGGIPSVLNTMILFLGITILEIVMVGIFSILGAEPVDLWVLWVLKKLILLPVLVYLALMCKRLLAGSEAIAEGRQEARVDTSRMFGGFKECGENLNNIGLGISKAVAERMKSEHLKTELITNVTHDIKTPLTSIINYANLIAEEPVENEKITEYAEVLVRQSGRLKKLLEDLLEASKATTGNLEVALQSCEVSVILSQAIGEYQQRMEEKQLELIVTQPEQPVNIMADGRHLWRVFDNLLNNICKYAREDSRVYLNVEVTGRRVSIIFRNMSKYALNITPEELQERFVRGDKSRHMEGNGLGLSIAKSLTELQNGRLEIITDGDLFKVSVLFEMI